MSSATTIDSLLDRPLDQRLREFKYRFAQAVVFGLPVLALEIWGPRLGGSEAPRWVGLLQLLLAGWVVYVGAMGMLFEGALLLARRNLTADLIVSLAACFIYVYSTAALAGHVIGLFHQRMIFHVPVLIVAVYSGWRWWRVARSER